MRLLKKYNPDVHDIIQRDIKKECFINCGVCPGDGDLWQAYNDMDQIDSGIHCAVGEHEITNATTAAICSDSRCEQHLGNWYLVAYTDGSAHNPENRLTSRAGWAVWYSANSPYNIHAPLCGLVQTSYKAEARALLHIVRTAGCPTLIKCDCLSVVNTFNSILNDADYSVEGCADGDVWRAIAYILADAPQGFLRCQWIPAHLNDPEHPNYKKRGDYISKGVVTELDIQGNSEADRCADLGVGGHADISRLIVRTTKRRGINRLA